MTQTNTHITIPLDSNIHPSAILNSYNNLRSVIRGIHNTAHIKQLRRKDRKNAIPICDHEIPELKHINDIIDYLNESDITNYYNPNIHNVHDKTMTLTHEHYHNLNYSVKMLIEVYYPIYKRYKPTLLTAQPSLMKYHKEYCKFTPFSEIPATLKKQGKKPTFFIYNIVKLYKKLL